ncbi:MAG: hypothetical protein ACYC6N_24760 [Pirellulaceae bacterium]
MSGTKERSPDAQQAVILERLFTEPRPPGSSSGGWVRWLLQLTLMLGSVWTISLLKKPVPSLSLWDFQDLELVGTRMQTAASHFALQTLLFFLLGLFLPVIFRVRRRQTPRVVDRVLTINTRPGRLRAAIHPAMKRIPNLAPANGTTRRLIHRIASFTLQAATGSLFLVATLAASLAVATMLVDALGLSSAIDVGLALLGVSVGIWVGRWASQGWPGVAQLLSHAAAATLILAFTGLWLKTQLAQAEPYNFPTPKVTSADKRNLVDAVRQQSEKQEGYRVYHVTTEHLNKLLAWWIAVQASDNKARVDLTDHEQKIMGSLRFSADPHVARPYLNLSATGQCEIVDEQLDLDLRGVQIGAIRIPAAVTVPLGRYLAKWINDDPVNQNLLVGVSAVMTHRNGVDLFVADDGIPRQRLSKLVQQVADQPDFAPAVRQYLDALAETVAIAKRKDPLFDVVVRRAFTMARERSRTSDAVSENQASILALGIALGMLSLDQYVGNVWEPGTRPLVARIPNRSKLHNRTDWPRHFWVSAALTVMANNRVSDALGLLKEELDAGEGGSGFSFGDLAADRAGIAFANAAIRDTRSATAIQDWILAETTDLQQLMPAAHDLPEGLSDQDLLRDFDGVDGTRFRQTVAEIDRRIQELSWGKRE